MSEHGAATMKEWIGELVEVARSGRSFETSAGADPGRAYAYLEYHLSDDEHSILLLRVEEDEGRPQVKAYRFQGNASDVRDQVAQLTHG